MTYELPRIVLSEEKLSLAVESGKRRTVSVTIGNEAEMHMKGLVYSTNPKVTVASGQFSGSESLIEFSCNAEYAEVGSRIKGKLCFVTNCGEISLPYSFKVIAPVLISMEGPVINMVQFAALARSNQTEAKRLFLSSEFTVFAAHHEPDSLVIRERLLRSPSADIALEQFLIATGRKMKVQLETSEQQKSYNAGNTSFSDSIKIIKGNWGYVSLNASVSGGFIELETENISNDDFAGSEYELHYIIYPERMQPGINMANIVLTGCGMKKVIPITCRLPHADKEALGKQRMLDRLMIKAMENYIAYSLDQIPAGRYVSEARALIEQYESTIGEEKLELKLYKSQLLRLSGKESPALSLLNSVEKEELNNATVFAKGLYFFIMAQRKDESAADYAEQLYTLSDVNPENVYLSLLAYRLEKRYEKNLKAGFEELRKMYLSGSRSPIMYMYAARQLNAEPLLLKELDDFEVQVVNFSVKKGFCSRDVASQYTDLVLRSRAYFKIYYNTLAAIYDRFQLTDALTAICQLLIKGYKRESRYFKWYQKGVEENIRQADLYEYYMYSLDRDVEEDLDQSVLMYYVYNSKLNERKLAYLYANIVLHKESNPIVYENYKEKLRIFALQQMRDGRNNRILSILYNDCLADSKLRSQFEEYLYKVIFRYEVKCDNPFMKYVCVSHKELEDEVIVPLIGGCAQIDIFTENALVLLLDASNNRYYLKDELSIERLLSDDSLIMSAYAAGSDKTQLVLSLGEKAHLMRKYDMAAIELRKQISSMQGVKQEVKDMYLSELVLYYYDHSQDDISEEDLERLDYKKLGQVRRGKFIGLLILREKYLLADKLIRECGFEEVDPRLLEKYVVSMPPAVLTRYDKTLLDIMYFLFRDGRRHERILIYLVSFYGGLTSGLYDIWQEAVNAKCATSDFDERLLVQILFTESYLPYGEQVYLHYYRRQKNRTLTKAYFNYLAYKYLISDVPISSLSVESMKRDAYYETNDIVLLALLKQYANAAELTSEEQDFARVRLSDMVSRGKVLPCFMNFSKYFRLPEDMEDKVYIEYRSNPDHRISIHLATREEGRRIVREEAMRNVCYGIFVKELVLFLGESVEYVITDEDGKAFTATEKQVLTGSSDPLGKSRSRFARINAIINAKNMRDKDKAIELLNEYVKNEFAISQLFHEIG